METLKDENVIEFDFNNIFMKKVSYIELQELIVSKADDKKTNYLFLDEVQEIENFEKCIVNLFEHRTIKFDIYITGSNSKMFSSSLTALFTGKNIEIKVFPLSFKEYFSYCKERNGNIQKLECFLKYVEYGGLPIILDYVDKEDNTRKIIEKVLADSVEIDVKRRHQIKTNAFQNLLKYIYAHVGQVISGINIANFLKSNVEAINYKTIMRYIG
jgi:predicted AAA+ superfamily ATPase